jgi:hypothetical protein
LDLRPKDLPKTKLKRNNEEKAALLKPAVSFHGSPGLTENFKHSPVTSIR